jgi:coenzyme F420 biosynthesis associated uncharacterized protein
VSGEGHDGSPTVDLVTVARQSEQLLSNYTGLATREPMPMPEAVDRSTWIEANIASMSKLIDPATARVGSNLGPASGIVRAGLGTVLAAEIGGTLGYLSQRVLGQYDFSLLDPDVSPRLLFVAPNLTATVNQLDLRSEDLWRWVALHEVTHVLQFGGVPWLRGRLAQLLEELLATFDIGIDFGRLRQLPQAQDLRKLAQIARNEGLFAAAATPRQRELFNQIQSLMALVEGYAEHTMDAVGLELLPNLPQLRSALTKRRQSQSALVRILNRLLGLDIKMRQYEMGKRFCDIVVSEQTISTLNRVWDSPQNVPSLPELENPYTWIERINK